MSLHWPSQRPPLRVALLRALPALTWAAVIFAFSAQPDLPHVPQSLLDLLVRKGAHMTEYAILAVLLYRALVPAVVREGPSAPLLAWLLAVAYAMSDEVHQSFVPGRTAAVLDVGIDATGALLGLIALHLVHRVRHRRAATVGARVLAAPADPRLPRRR